jgi:hypothetical protein
MLIPIGFFGGGGSAGAYEQIATAFGTGSSGVVTFSSIPSTYKHLQIRIVSREANGVRSDNPGFRITLNGSTASNYARHILQGNGSAVTSAASSAAAFMLNGFSAGASNDTNSFGATIIDILDYASASKNTTLRTLSGSSTSSNPRIGLHSGLWNVTDAVTSITLTDNEGLNYTSSSRFSLYGIKG